MTAAVERSSIRFGRTTIDYSIKRSARRGTVSVAVAPNQGVVLTAPADVTVDRLDRVVRTKAGWIMRHLRVVERYASEPPAKEWISGASILYLGRHYRLRVVSAADDAEAYLSRGWLVVPVRRGRSESQRAVRAREAVTQWLSQHAAMRVAERVAYWSRRFKVRVPRVIVKEQRKRWGSCDRSGCLRFNWRIVQAPMRLVDYVVIHELAHLVHADHGRAFWRLLGRTMPDYETRRASLAALGPNLEW